MSLGPTYREQAFCALVWALLVPILGLPLLFLWFLRRSVHLIGSAWFGLVPAGACDTYWSADELYVRPAASLGAMVPLAGRLDLAAFTAFCNQEFFQTPANQERFSRLEQFPTYFLGYLFFRRSTEFRVQEHINEVEEPTDLRAFVADWIHAPYQRRKPLWQLTLVQGPETTTVLVKSHHIIGDGISLLMVLDTLSGQRRPFPTVPEGRIPKFSSLDKAKLLWNSPLFISELFEVLSSEEKAETSQDVLSEWVQLDFKSIQQVRQRTGAHVSSIVATVLSGAWEAVQTHAPSFGKGPQKLRRVTTPVLSPFRPMQLCNAWGVAFFRIPQSRNDPSILGRLQAAESGYNKVMTQRAPLFGTLLFMEILALFPRLAYHWVVRSSGASAPPSDYANVAGPAETAIFGVPARTAYAIMGVFSFATEFASVSLTNGKEMNIFVTATRRSITKGAMQKLRVHVPAQLSMLLEEVTH